MDFLEIILISNLKISKRVRFINIFILLIFFQEMFEWFKGLKFN